MAGIRRIIGLLLASVVIVAAGAGCGSGDTAGPGDTAGSQEPTFSFVIPAGSNERIAQGEPLDILPRELVAQRNDTIIITNEDDAPHFLGPWFLGPHETLRQRFVEVGVFEGECTVHPSGEFTVIVEA